MYGDGALTALGYAMNTEFGRILANEMVSLEYSFFVSLSSLLTDDGFYTDCIFSYSFCFLETL